jgi:predicted dehydrogenase
VRWTERRNFEAVLDMLADGRLDVAPLVSHRFALAEAQRAYEVVAGAEPSLGIVLEYPRGEAARLLERTVVLGVSIRHSGREAGIQAREGNLAATSTPKPTLTSTPTVSFIGAGNYATGVLIPAFKAAGAVLRTVASSGGVSGVHAGRKFGFAQTTTDTEALLTDAGTTALVITTRHDSHARWVMQGLAAGKAVFVEKPLCLTLEELAAIGAEVGPLSPGPSPTRGEGSEEAVVGGAPLLMVGFNRRFAPQVQKIKALLAGVTGPKALVMTVNAGAIPAEHWTQDPAVGGRRIIGEACHFIDLLRFLAGAPIARAEAVAMDAPTRDSVSINLHFADGSLGTLLYLANGSKAFPKERLEVFAAGRVLQLDNFRKLTGFGWPGFRQLNLWRQDKGQQACAAAFVQALCARAAGQAAPPPIPLEEILEVSRVTIEVAGCL